jgi:hypothetical protein
MRSLGIPLSHFVGLAGCKAEESVLDVRYARDPLGEVLSVR